MLKHLSILAVTAAIATPLWAVSAQAATSAACQAKLDKVENTYKEVKASHYIPTNKRLDLTEMMERAADNNKNHMPDKCLRVLKDVQNELVFIEGRWRQ